MALSTEALLERRKGIGGSDAAKIVSGEWYDLWLDKTGRSEPEDLSGVFAVQLGNVTEALNLDWFTLKTGAVVADRGRVVLLDGTALRCTLDGMSAWNDRPAVIQAKHVNPFAKIDEVRARYTPQVMHECLVTGCRQGILSVIIGTSEPVLELIEMDDFWATEYVAKCHEFWGYVQRDEAPPRAAGAIEAPPPPSVMRVVDMQGSNAWASFAADWLEHGAAAKKFDAATKGLKGLVEADVREAAGNGVRAVRSKAGAISIKETK